MSYISRVTPTCCELELNDQHLDKQMSALKPYKAMGHDEIRSQDLKIAGESVKPGIRYILQKSLNDKKFPDNWKIAKLRTTFKRGEACSRENYRPLSILSIPSKLLEGQVCHKVDKHMEVSGIGHTNQWGFKEGRSTEGLLLHLTEHWKGALDNGQYVGVLFVDFKKAFDSVNRDILKRKLQASGFCGALYDWICDYLSQRMQYADVNGKTSTIKEIEFGVPQGSLQGPRLFSIHVNDLPDSISRGELVMFADDTTIFCTGDNIEEVIDGLNASARELLDWCNRNQLTVHAGKTEAMILSPKKFIGPLRPILYGTSVINYVKQSTSLGIIIDDKLSWEKQLTKVTNSFNGKMKELKRLRYLPIKIQEEIYFKTVVSAATYCITVWGTSSPAILNAVDALHARAAKMIHKIKGARSTEEILNKAGWEPISYIYKKRVLTWMHRIYYKTCPKQIYEQFSERKTNLRNPLKLKS